MIPLLWAFLLTAFVEGAAVGLAFRKLRPVYISLLCNLLTNPATNVLLAVLVMWLGSRAYYPVLLCLELAAVGGGNVGLLPAGRVALEESAALFFCSKRPFLWGGAFASIDMLSNLISEKKGRYT